MTLIEVPEISEVKVQQDRAMFVASLPDNLLYFQGHFPGTPILPGVVQIHWAIIWAKKLLNIDKKFVGMDQIKFHMPAKPGDCLSVELEWHETKPCLEFKYSLAKCVISSGRIRLK